MQTLLRDLRSALRSLARPPLCMLAAVAVALLAVSVLAGLAPARKASRTDPVNVLRVE